MKLIELERKLAAKQESEKAVTITGGKAHGVYRSDCT